MSNWGLISFVNFLNKSTIFQELMEFMHLETWFVCFMENSIEKAKKYLTLLQIPQKMLILSITVLMILKVSGNYFIIGNKVHE